MNFGYWWLILIPLNWLLPLVISYSYVGILRLTGDVKFEGWVKWSGFLPVARFRLISHKSWYARAWEGWYGLALMLVMIHRDEKGSKDDDQVEETIVHEMRHITQILVLGMMMWVLYFLHNMILMFQGKELHKNNWFENDARKYEDAWVYAGRPKRYDLGKRV